MSKIFLSDYDKLIDLGVSITKRGNAQVLTGGRMRYDITAANTSNVALENFYWHDRILADAVRAVVLTIDTYSARLNYRVLYKTNYTTVLSGYSIQPATTGSCSFSANAVLVSSFPQDSMKKETCFMIQSKSRLLWL